MLYLELKWVLLYIPSEGVSFIVLKSLLTANQGIHGIIVKQRCGLPRLERSSKNADSDIYPLSKFL